MNGTCRRDDMRAGNAMDHGCASEESLARLTGEPSMRVIRWFGIVVVAVIVAIGALLFAARFRTAQSA